MNFLHLLEAVDFDILSFNSDVYISLSINIILMCWMHFIKESCNKSFVLRNK